MLKASLLLLFVAWSNNLLAQSVKKTMPLVIGESILTYSKILDEDRRFNIYLPAGYEEDTTRTYPVIYILDGSTDEDFIHIAGIVQFGTFSWIDMLPKSIVVGIANVDRKRDFTYPSTYELDQKEFPTSGKSERFIQFVERELQPLIDKRYRTEDKKTIIGQSLGGLLATEILFTKPDLFDNYIIVSPSLWWDSEKLLDAKPKAYTTEKSVYIAGGKEGPVMERVARELYAKLKTGKHEKTKLYFEFLEERDHGDALHLAVYNAFEKIFKKKSK